MFLKDYSLERILIIQAFSEKVVSLSVFPNIIVMYYLLLHSSVDPKNGKQYTIWWGMLLEMACI